MKNLAIFVLDDPTRLISLNSGLQALIAAGTRIQAWCRAEDFEAMRVLPAELDLHAIDPLLWQSEGLRPWWAQCFGPALAVAQDHTLILDSAFTWTTEKIVLLFPGTRQTLWIREDRDTASMPESDESIGLVNRVEQVARRFGLPRDVVASNALDGARHAAEAARFIETSGFGAGAFMVCDLDSLAADPAEAEALAAVVAESDAARTQQPGAVLPGPLRRLVVQHDGRPETDPAAFCQALGARGIATLPLNRNEVPWPVRVGLLYLSSGYFGVTGPGCDAASAIGRPIVALHGGRAWRELLPHARWGFCLGCDLPQQGRAGHVVGAISKDDIRKALLQICTRWQTPFTVVTTPPQAADGSTRHRAV